MGFQLSLRDLESTRARMRLPLGLANVAFFLKHNACARSVIHDAEHQALLLTGIGYVGVPAQIAARANGAV